jgi:hypothetical protein
MDGHGGTGFFSAGGRTPLIEESRGIALLSPEPPYRTVSLLMGTAAAPELGARFERNPAREVVWPSPRRAPVLDGAAPIRGRAPELAYTVPFPSTLKPGCWPRRARSAALVGCHVLRYRRHRRARCSTSKGSADSHRGSEIAGTGIPGSGQRSPRHAPQGGTADIVRYGMRPGCLPPRAGPMCRAGKR